MRRLGGGQKIAASRQFGSNFGNVGRKNIAENPNHLLLQPTDATFTSSTLDKTRLEDAVNDGRAVCRTLLGIEHEIA